MNLLSLAAVCCLVSTLVESKTFLFPDPQTVNWYGTSAILSDRLRFSGVNNSYVKNAVQRYSLLIKEEKWVPVQVPSTNFTVEATSETITGIDFKIQNNKAKLDIGIDESYSLNVPTNGGQIELRALTWVGALRALETFSQLVEQGPDDSLVIHTAYIRDKPTYGHRGILLDTSRQFYPVTSILRIIDAQVYNKMNVLHWHATDSQSWPLYFRSHPELSDKGAYSKKETYNPSDVKGIITYAESRGIRVILEIDMPAHTASIGESHPDLLICADEFWAEYATEPPAGQLNPINPEAISLVKDLIVESTATFPDTLFHAGGDEINTACWDLSPQIRDYVKRKKFTSSNQVWFEFTNTILDFILNKTRKRPIIWEDPIKSGGSYPNSTVVQVWLSPPGTYTKLGHDVIVTSYDYFYLDCGHGGWVGNDDRYISPTQSETAKDVFNYGGGGGSWCAPFKTWQRIYSYDMTLGINESDTGKILGGEVAMWSEQTGPTVVEGRLFPRTAAAAEVYWSGSYDKEGKRRTVEDVSERFYDWGYRLQSRGINSEPVQPKYCHKHPGACDLNDPNTK
ncbi:glycoside hydrolase superfamily [Helicostylum pulchrum]|nr:glycoside hydrolase superfamily [Helicostylum pulchrum]